MQKAARQHEIATSPSRVTDNCIDKLHIRSLVGASGGTSTSSSRSATHSQSEVIENILSDHQSEFEEDDQLVGMLDLDDLIVDEMKNLSNPSTVTGFETLPSVILAEVCSLLTLDETFASLPSLSSVVAKTLHVSRGHNSNGWITINFSNFKRGYDGRSFDSREQCIEAKNAKSAGRMKHLAEVNRVAINFDRDAIQHDDALVDTFVSKCGSQLVENQLIDLFLCDRFNTTIDEDSLAVRVLSYALNDTNMRSVSTSSGDMAFQPSLSLKRLSLVVNSFSWRLSDWACLHRLSSLQRLSLNLGMSLYDMFPSIFIAIPPSVKSLELIVDMWCESECVTLLEEKLADIKFLPLLERIHLNCGSTHHPYKASYLPLTACTTVMESTGSIRPIKTLCAEFKDFTSLQCCQNLQEIEELDVAPFSDEVGLQLSTCSSDQFPHLRIARMAGEMLNKHCLDYFVDFVSKREIVDLNVKLTMTDQGLVRSPLTLQNVGLCTSLQSLIIEIRYSSAIERLPVVDGVDNVDAHSIGIPAGSLPHLVVLRLAWNTLTVSVVEKFLAAAPNCQEAHIDSATSTVNPCVIIAMILHHCSEICRIFVISQCLSINEDADRTLDSYPNPNSGLSKLLSVYCRNSFKLEQATLHRLINRLCMAPRLAFVKISHAVDYPTMYMLHRLTGLITHRFFNKTAWNEIPKRSRTHFDIPSLNDCFKVIRTQEFISPLQRELTRSSSLPSTLNVQTVTEIMTEQFDEDSTYKGFDPSVDKAGNTGRERYFNILHSLLSESDKAKFAAWDQGDYAWRRRMKRENLIPHK